MSATPTHTHRDSDGAAAHGRKRPSRLLFVLFVPVAVVACLLLCNGVLCCSAALRVQPKAAAGTAAGVFGLWGYAATARSPGRDRAADNPALVALELPLYPCTPAGGSQPGAGDLDADGRPTSYASGLQDFYDIVDMDGPAAPARIIPLEDL